MRDQVVTPRGSSRSGSTVRSRTGGVTQRPLKRDRAGGGKFNNDRLSSIRRVLGWVPTAVKIGLAVCLIIFVFAGYRAAASASFFQIRTIDVNGTARTSSDEVKSLVRKFGSQSGVWRADLDQISQEIGKLTWVKTAVVSRVLPDGIRVRIIERTPRGVVHLSSGRFIWVDEDAVELGEIKSTDPLPPFFLRGWDEEPSTEAKAANTERINRYMEMVQSFGAAGVASRISEIDLNDMVDIRAHLSGDDSGIEIRLGGWYEEHSSENKDELASRMEKGLKVLDGKRNTARFKDITYVDLSQGTRGIVGLSNGGNQIAHASDLAVPQDEPTSGAQGETPGGPEGFEPQPSSAKALEATKRNQHREAAKSQSPTSKRTEQNKKGSKGTDRTRTTGR